MYDLAWIWTTINNLSIIIHILFGKLYHGFPNKVAFFGLNWQICLLLWRRKNIFFFLIPPFFIKRFLLFRLRLVKSLVIVHFYIVTYMRNPIIFIFVLRKFFFRKKEWKSDVLLFVFSYIFNFNKLLQILLF